MFIGMSFDGVAEPKPVPAGRYDLTIAEAKLPPIKEGKGQNIEVSIGIDSDPTAPNLRHFISLPKPDDDASKANFKKLMLMRFLEQFHIPYDPQTGFNVEDFAGAHGQAELTLSEPDDQTGAVYNRLKLDRISDQQ